MSLSPTPPSEPTQIEETVDMDAAPPAEGEQGEQAQASGKSKPKKTKASEPPRREPGKSLFPYSRVQKILKADRDLIMVQREAVFLISRATEEFVARIAQSSQAVAAREGRATVQAKDLIACVRRGEEYAFLEEAMPCLEPEPASTKSGKEKEKGGKPAKSAPNADGSYKDDRAPTMLDHFVNSGKEVSQEPQAQVFVNDDGTLSGGGPSEVPS